MVMRAHAAMSPIKQQRSGLDTTSTNGTIFFLLLEPTRVPWRRWLVNATNPTTFPGFETWNRHQNWRHIPPHRMRETRGPRLCWRSNICDVASSTCSGVAFLNARREEVDRLRVTAISCVRGLGRGIFLQIPSTPVGYAVDG